MKSPDEKIWSVILSFPCLRKKFGENPRPGRFDPDKLFAVAGPWSHGERLCVHFVLNVWNPGYAEAKGWQFNVFDFVGTADFETMEAFMHWLNQPIWP